MGQGTRADDAILGNRSLSTFDVCIIGSGAGGGTAAHILTAAGKKVLVLEAGINPWPQLDRSDLLPLPVHNNDELKYDVRGFLQQDPDLEPRTFRPNATVAAQRHPDVNLLPKTVGGAFTHADCKTPRFNEVDFRLKSAIEETLQATPGLAVPGFGNDAESANFADWPLTYAELEPYYVEVERLYGVQGSETDNPFASFRSRPYPMPPGVPMYLGLILKRGCERTSYFGEPLHPHTFPAAIASRFYEDRPPCVDCGLCSGFGCPNNSKGSPAVTTLRKALLSGRCQLRYNAQVVELLNSGSHVFGVQYVDADGAMQTVTADAFVLAASAIESARICLLSGIGNSSGQVGRNLMFHLQNGVNGFLPERVHGQRGRAVTHGVSDFRGVEPGGTAVRVLSTDDGPRVYLGGICEFSASQGKPITEDGLVYAMDLPGTFGRRMGIGLKNALRDGALGQHLFGLLMQAEDAPQLTNAIDLDPTIKDIFGRPVPRVTYAPHAYEKQTRLFYVPIMKDVVLNAGATKTFVTPCDALFGPPTSRHVLGTLRMGTNPRTSVVNATGRFHDVDNLFACDGSVFVTSSGYNPTLTIFAVAAKIAHGMAGTDPETD